MTHQIIPIKDFELFNSLLSDQLYIFVNTQLSLQKICRQPWMATPLTRTRSSSHCQLVVSTFFIHQMAGQQNIFFSFQKGIENIYSTLFEMILYVLNYFFWLQIQCNQTNFQTNFLSKFFNSIFLPFLSKAVSHFFCQNLYL